MRTVIKTCQDCGKPCEVLATAAGNFKRCPECAKAHKNIQKMERYREKESRGAHDGMLWRLVDAPDIEYWGRITCLTEGDIEIGAKLGSIAQGSKFVKFTQPSVVGVVRGKRLEVR